MLAEKGSNFDVASPAEIALCLGNGATADRLSFGNTIKKEKDIAFAYEAGVRLFAFDSEARTRKAGAPGARCARLLPHPGVVRGRGLAAVAQVRLHPGDGGRACCTEARALGLDPYGVSFHVGSQQTDLGQWDRAIGAVARMFTLLAETDINLRMVNIGGGFPAQYRGEIASIERYAQAVTDALTRAFRQPPARDHRRAGALAGRRCRA